MTSCDEWNLSSDIRGGTAGEEHLAASFLVAEGDASYPSVTAIGECSFAPVAKKNAAIGDEMLVCEAFVMLTERGNPFAHYDTTKTHP